MSLSNTSTKPIIPKRILMTGGYRVHRPPPGARLLELGWEVAVYTRYVERARRRVPPGPVQWLDDLEQIPADARFDVMICC